VTELLRMNVVKFVRIIVAELLKMVFVNLRDDCG
jgi:hypothetical protein